MCSFDPSVVPFDEILIYEDDEPVFDGSDPDTYITLDAAAGVWGYDVGDANAARGGSDDAAAAL